MSQGEESLLGYQCTGRCKRCYHPHEKMEMPRFLPWDLCKYVLNKYSEIAPPFHLTAEDIEEELDSSSLSRHRICRGLGGKTAVQYYTHWTGLEKCTWEHEVELEQYGDVVLKYWSNQPEQVSGGNAMYRRYRVQLAKRAVAGRRGERHVARGYKLCCDVRGRPEIMTTNIIGAYVYFKTVRAGWQFAKVVQVVEESGSSRVMHTLKLLDMGKNINVELKESSLNTDELIQEPGTWCWHAHITQKDVKKYMHAIE